MEYPTVCKICKQQFSRRGLFTVLECDECQAAKAIEETPSSPLFGPRPIRVSKPTAGFGGKRQHSQQSSKYPWGTPLGPQPLKEASGGGPQTDPQQMTGLFGSKIELEANHPTLSPKPKPDHPQVTGLFGSNIELEATHSTFSPKPKPDYPQISCGLFGCNAGCARGQCSQWRGGAFTAGSNSQQQLRNASLGGVSGPQSSSQPVTPTVSNPSQTGGLFLPSGPGLPRAALVDLKPFEFLKAENMMRMGIEIANRRQDEVEARQRRSSFTFGNQSYEAPNPEAIIKWSYDVEAEFSQLASSWLESSCKMRGFLKRMDQSIQDGRPFSAASQNAPSHE
ncbi:uncharacterized protein BP5553_01127 [Venustampulla echinocandica]|uniref:Uncharacterized protein n=1 Tax=Venustampulla echinocandica TaxID=2656787 RepID=A0A370U055_9HELO|nr:uncharacterized protein BP5553_01127 [Venustampulla echinocandica]RDL41148.1 hypothetical protein BP5553_01127 [Venustampulla echinocandica]